MAACSARQAGAIFFHLCSGITAIGFLKKKRYCHPKADEMVTSIAVVTISHGNWSHNKLYLRRDHKEEGKAASGISTGCLSWKPRVVCGLSCHSPPRGCLLIMFSGLEQPTHLPSRELSHSQWLLLIFVLHTAAGQRRFLTSLPFTNRDLV